MYHVKPNARRWQYIVTWMAFPVAISWKGRYIWRLTIGGLQLGFQHLKEMSTRIRHMLLSNQFIGVGHIRIERFIKMSMSAYNLELFRTSPSK